MVLLTLGVLLYVSCTIIGIGLIMNTPMFSMMNGGDLKIVPLEMVSGILLVLFGFFLLFLIVKGLNKRMVDAKQSFLNEHRLVPDDRIILRHEKDYEDVPLRLISITLPGNWEIYTDVCTIEEIESTWEAYIFDIPENYTVVLRHMRSKEWETYSQA